MLNRTMGELLQLPLSQLVTFVQDRAAKLRRASAKSVYAIRPGCHPICQDPFVAPHTPQAAEPLD